MRLIVPLASLSFAILSNLLPIQAAEFSWDAMRLAAQELAKTPYRAPQDDLADFWKNLNYDQHRDIRFKMDSGLWAPEKLPFSVDFFHPGWTAKRMITLHEVTNQIENTLKFDRSLFDYGKQKVPSDTASPRGYAGWRARCHLNSSDYMDEFLVFLGASYFRAIPANSPYGLSARGISINSGLPGIPEEFPDFTEFYLERPKQDSKSLRAWALLNGDSVAGAYQFTITPGPETVMEIDAEITLRRPVQQLGLAPFSSMFWFGEGTHPKPYDFRPEIHDSDGLLMELESGNFHYRPLEHHDQRFRHCVFTLEKPRSWALVQRDRSFASYQDVEANYHLRPSVRVEPISGFDQGKLHLIEMPTIDETNDNVILLWDPQPALVVGKPFRFQYRLRWLRDPAPSGLFAVRASRCGHPVQRPNQLLFTIDFAKPLQPQARVGNPVWDDISKLTASVHVNRKNVKIIHSGITDLSMPNVDDLPANIGRSDQLHMPQVLRAFFVLECPPEVEDLDLFCELLDDSGKAVSERWLQYWQK